jgi:hypothetical protein
MIREDDDLAGVGELHELPEVARHDHVRVDDHDHAATLDQMRVGLQVVRRRRDLGRHRHQARVRLQEPPLPIRQAGVDDGELALVAGQAEGVEQRDDAGEVRRVRNRVVRWLGGHFGPA